MKKILSLILVVASFALCASAQLGTNTSQSVGANGGSFTIMPGGTNNVLGQTTNTYTINVTNVGANGLTNVVAYPVFILPVGYTRNVGIDISEANIGAANATNG